MRNKILLFLFFVFAGSQVEAQLSKPVRPGKTRGEYSLDLHVAGGIGYYLNIAGLPGYLKPEIANWSPVATVRIMWNPDHRIKVGIETGRMQFLDYVFKDSIGNSGRIIVNAVPVLVEWSMALSRRFNVFAGSGVYFLRTKMEYAGLSFSNKLSIGWMGAISYLQPLNKDLSIGSELKWMDAAETTDGSLALQVNLVWKFLKW
jgi:hypothetical protein